MVMLEGKKMELYNRALTLWGIDLQLGMLIEEQAELTKALCKYIRGKRSTETVKDIAEEIADVEIMLEQVKRIFRVMGSHEFGFQFENHMQECKKSKLERLEAMIKIAEEKQINA